jgi:hypothetical protein
MCILIETMKVARAVICNKGDKKGKRKKPANEECPLCLTHFNGAGREYLYLPSGA